jgi:hypothetical protein
MRSRTTDKIYLLCFEERFRHCRHVFLVARSGKHLLELIEGGKKGTSTLNPFIVGMLRKGGRYKIAATYTGGKPILSHILRAKNTKRMCPHCNEEAK